MTAIVLATLNARYQHASFGLRYLLANMGTWRAQTSLLEFDIQRRPVDVAEAILACQPRIVGLGVYVWNARESLELAAILKRLAPQVTLVLGGPEVSYETEQQEITRWADYVICGEADLEFARLCGQLLVGERPLLKIISAQPPELTDLVLPYDLYDAHDLEHRVVYVEASRGCPFSCEFCLSSLDIPVRQFPLEPFLTQMKSLLDRGLRQFKFVDRTFNLDLKTSQSILEFFLPYCLQHPDLFLHFEMIPDRLPQPLRQWISRFPPGSLQLEVGIQTFNEQVAQRISRRQDNAKVQDNLRWLADLKTVHVHADLIVGLPGETLESFAHGFNHLLTLEPHEIQIGILKRLRGTPIARHDQTWQMVYSPYAPYEILSNNLIDFPTMQRLRRMARTWEITVNSGRFKLASPLIWSTPGSTPGSSPGSSPGSTPGSTPGSNPFEAFLQWSDWLCARAGRTHSIALPRLLEFLFEYLTQSASLEPAKVAQALLGDYQRTGHSDRPACLQPYLPASSSSTPSSVSPGISPRIGPKRQARHRM